MSGLSDAKFAFRRRDHLLAGMFGGLPSSHLGGAGFDLVLAFLSPNDRPDAGGGSTGERHRLGAVGVHGSPMVNSLRRAPIGCLGKHRPAGR